MSNYRNSGFGFRDYVKYFVNLIDFRQQCTHKVADGNLATSSLIKCQKQRLNTIENALESLTIVELGSSKYLYESVMRGKC